MRFALIAFGCVLAIGIAYSDSDAVHPRAARGPSNYVERRDPVLLAPAQQAQRLSKTSATAPKQADVADRSDNEALGPLPKDPIEHGDSTLRLSLTDASTGEAAWSRVQLWRVDAPGNESWTRGDQLQADSKEIESSTHRFSNLTKGTYRIHAEHQAKGSKDLPNFVVGPGENRITQSLPMPRSFPILVEVHNERGIALPSATYWCSFYGMDINTTRPRWVAPRSPRGRSAVTDFLAHLHYECDEHFDECVPIQAERGFFAIGDVSEDSRVDEEECTCSLFVPGYVTVQVRASYEFPRPHVFRVTTVPVSDVLDVVRLPDGRRAVDAGATVEASVDAQLEGRPGWSTGVRVVAELDGYGRLVRRMPLGERWDPIEMIPATKPKPEGSATLSK